MATKGWENYKPGADNQKQTPQQRTQALGRLEVGTMNKTETAYANLLEARKMAGEILWYEFEPFNLRLGKDLFYNVDFVVMLKNRELECHEVKGHWTDKARVKTKAAAAKFHFFKFIGVQLIKGQWVIEHF